MIHQHRALNLIDGRWQGKRIGLAPTGQRTHNDKSASPVVAPVGHNECWTPLGLLPSRLGIEVEPEDVACFGCVGCPEARHHSKRSFPRSGPDGISS
jgi:hypothetical protein